MRPAHVEEKVNDFRVRVTQEIEAASQGVSASHVDSAEQKVATQSIGP